MSKLPNHIPNFSNAQLELLKVFAGNLSEAETLLLRDLLLRFKADLLLNKIAKYNDEKGYTDEVLEQWLNDENQ